MVAAIEKIDRISTNRISYYSIKFGNQVLTEYDIFDQKHFPEHALESQILNKIIQQMGFRGAKPYYFKPENGAYALPIVSPAVKRANKKDFGLRLYCIHLSESVVILLNGDIKTVPNSAQNCPNVKHYFAQAVSLERKIRAAITDGYMFIKPFLIQIDDGFVIDL